MYYERILLEDFGVFQHADLRDVDPGLTVIAGPQRAGKTTFMEAVRRLGYGIGQGDDVPPAADTYRLGAELRHDGTPYRLRVNGHGDPTLTPLAGDGAAASLQSTDDVFGAISKERYRQLYTISLDQLQRLPPAVEDPEDLSRILLGAAYGSIADLPEVKSTFDDLADDIGRKRGHPRYGEFSDAFERIEAAQDDLDEANEQVERYDEKRSDLADVEARIDDLDAERASLQRERQRLNVVQQYFEEVQEYRRLGERLGDIDPGRREAFPSDGLERARDLREDYRDARDAVESARESFESQTVADEPAAQREALLAIEGDLGDFQNEIAGWRERLRSVRETETDLDERRADLERRIRNLRRDWDGEFDEVRGIETDLASRDTVEQVVEAATEARAAVDDLSPELEAKRERSRELDDQLAAADEDGGAQQTLLIASGGGVVGVLAAIALAAVGGPVAGLIVGAVVVLAAAGVAFRRGGDGGATGSQATQLRAQKDSLEQEIAELAEQHEQATDRLDAAETELASLREEFGLDSDVSPDGVLEFYEAVVDLQADIADFESDREELRATREELVGELRGVAETLGDLQLPGWAGPPEDPLDDADSLFEAVETAATEADLAAEWDAARSERAEVRSAVATLVGEWETTEFSASDIEDGDATTVEDALEAVIDEGEVLAEAAAAREKRAEIANKIGVRFRTDAVREAFEPVYETPDSEPITDHSIEALEAELDQYADLDEVEARLNEINERLDEIEETETELEKERLDLEQELEDLASEDDLLEARREIQAGAREIERLGEQYATYRIAESITERLQEQFIEETTGPLLDEASEIFATITQEYDEVEHTGELSDLDFRVLQDGDAVHDRSELSRATAEQLFMAVRLARIRQIDAALPMVIDDALTNFDPAHSARTMQLIDRMARENQVFFLTAHPAFVDRAAEHADVAQYWRLEDGQFEGPFQSSEGVIEQFDTLAPAQSD